MGILTDIIPVMTKEEIRQLKIYLNRTKTKAPRKDVQLFDYLRKQGNEEEDKIARLLYNEGDKNAYYRLKNRLLEDIGKSITIQYFNHSDGNSVVYHLALSRLYQQKGQFKAATHYLNRAMKKASEIQSYELLDIIYSDFIKLSHETLSINPEHYIEKRKANRVQLSQLREIDDILAVLIYRIKLSQNYSTQNLQVLELLKETINDFTQNDAVKKSPQLRFKIYHSLSRMLLQQRDYVALEDYLLLTLKEFTDEKLFNKNNHDTRLQMLTYLTNTLIKNEKYEMALDYSGKLLEAMEDFDRMLYDKYLFYYYNTSSLTNSLLNRKDEAKELLMEAISRPEIVQTVPHGRVFFQLNLALIYFDQGHFKKASKEMVRLKLEDIFPNLDRAFQLKIEVVELIVRFELKDHDYLEYQAKQVRKHFGDLLNHKDYERQAQMIEVLEALVYADMRTDPDLSAKVDHLIASLPSGEAADNDILSYTDWLIARRG